MKKKNIKRKTKKICKIRDYSISVVLFILMLYLVYTIKKISFFHEIINIILSLFIVLMTLIVIFLINNRKVKDNIRNKNRTIAIISIIILFIVDFSSYKTFNFFNKISSSKGEIINYSVLVLENSNYKNLKKLKNQKIGYYALDDIEKYNLNINVEYISYDDINKLYLALFNNKVSAVVIDDMMKLLAEENNPNYMDKTKSVYKFSIKESSDLVSKNVDVLTKPFNIYLSGIDTYGDIASVSRSDVNILITINPLTRKILLTAIPRDYYVKLHSKSGYKDKLTHAGIYGVDESIATIEDLLSIDINYYIKVNFTSVIDIVDLLGGITVNSDYDFVSVDGYKFTKGVNNLNGEKALAFARERYAFAEGDLQRNKDQEEVIKALVKKATSPTILLKYNSLLSKLGKKVETNLSENEILSLIKYQLSNNIEWEIKSSNLDGDNSMEYTYSYPNDLLYVMLPREESIDKVKKKINEMLGE